jgi:hypothetical protein
MVHVYYDQERNFVTLTVDGALALKDVVIAVNEWFEHPQFADTINMLWDLRQAGWQSAVHEFLLVKDEITARVNQIWHGDKVAWLVDTETEVALVNMHLATLGWTAWWRGFTDKPEAISWLNS